MPFFIFNMMIFVTQEFLRVIIDAGIGIASSFHLVDMSTSDFLSFLSAKRSQRDEKFVPSHHCSYPKIQNESPSLHVVVVFVCQPQVSKISKSIEEAEGRQATKERAWLLLYVTSSKNISWLKSKTLIAIAQMETTLFVRRPTTLPTLAQILRKVMHDMV